MQGAAAAAPWAAWAWALPFLTALAPSERSATVAADTQVADPATAA